MPTKRKTSLYLVCFCSLFLITSCVNSKKSKVVFEVQNEESQAEVAILNRTDTSILIELTCISKSKNINIKDVSLKCLNPNPMGVNSVSVLETSENDSLFVQVYYGDYQGKHIRIILPYAKDKKTNHLDLKITDASKASLEMKLLKKN